MPLAEGGPEDMRIEGTNTLVVRDVLVGEVWIASGQSNMVWPVERSNNFEAEASAAKFPEIRLFKVALETAGEPLEDVEGEWQRCSPETVPGFSAVGYFFARRLHWDLRAPVGVIQSAWGGTPAEAWTSMEALESNPALDFYLERWDKILERYPSEMLRYKQVLEEWEERAARMKARGEDPPRRPRPPRGPGDPHAPASLYNAMIAPLVPYNIRGAIWYQGESNAGADQAYRYRRLFTTMIQDWRTRWGQGDFPFLFVQLANFQAVETTDWPVLRESQTEALHLVNTGMAVTTDIGNPNDIHPRNKQDVGERLARWALAATYGRDLVRSGPLYRQMTAEGSQVRLWFDHIGGGLEAAGGSLGGFVVAGPDRIFHPAQARIDDGTVVVSSDAVPAPAAVRYAWRDHPVNTLRNAEGLPASPFRTDQWDNGIMREEKE